MLSSIKSTHNQFNQSIQQKTTFCLCVVDWWVIDLVDWWLGWLALPLLSLLAQLFFSFIQQMNWKERASWERRRKATNTRRTPSIKSLIWICGGQLRNYFYKKRVVVCWFISIHLTNKKQMICFWLKKRRLRALAPLFSTNNN